MMTQEMVLKMLNTLSWEVGAYGVGPLKDDMGIFTPCRPRGETWTLRFYVRSRGGQIRVYYGGELFETFVIPHKTLKFDNFWDKLKNWDIPNFDTQNELYLKMVEIYDRFFENKKKNEEIRKADIIKREFELIDG